MYRDIQEAIDAGYIEHPETYDEAVARVYESFWTDPALAEAFRDTNWSAWPGAEKRYTEIGRKLAVMFRQHVEDEIGEWRDL